MSQSLSQSLSKSVVRRLVPALAAAIVLLALTIPSVAFAATASAHAATQHQQIARFTSSGSTSAQSEGSFTAPLTCFRDADGIVTCAYPGGSVGTAVGTGVSTGASSGGSFGVPLTCFRQANGIVLCSFPGQPQSVARR